MRFPLSRLWSRQLTHFVRRYVAHAPAQLIARLTVRSQHLLALRIAEFLRLSPAPVLRHWARATILAAKSTSADASATCALIVSKLKGRPGVSPADVARTAWESGQAALATKLLDHEPKARKQVPLLVSMKEDDLALVKAVQSSDPDLVYTVLLHLRKTHSLGNFLHFLDRKPDAAALLQVYARENDVELLRDFYYEDDRRTASACLALEEALALDAEAKTSKMRQAVKFFSEDKDRSFEQKAVEEHLRLLATQQGLVKDAGGAGHQFVGLSVNETIRQCIVAGMKKQADKVKAEFKVPDKRFWYVKMKALVEIRDWEGLASWAGKKSPIGFEVRPLGPRRSHRPR